jgi:hypothetical protein
LHLNCVVDFLLADHNPTHKIIFYHNDFHIVELKKIIFYSQKYYFKIMTFLRMDRPKVDVLLSYNYSIILKNLLLNLRKVFQRIVIILKYRFLYHSELFKIQTFDPMTSFEDTQMIDFLNEYFSIH